MGTLVGVGIVAAGLLAELAGLRDNSFLTHLATGRLSLDQGSIPTTDPYTFSAAGEPWVVQSWLVSVAYASLERLGGLDAVRLFTGALTGLLAGLGWRLLRPVDGLVTRLALGVLFVVVGAGMWAERPFMVGLIAFALTVLAAEGGLDPRWLVPLGWIWVNSHGSFPLGLVYLGAAAVGTRLDRGAWGVEARCLGFGALGMLLGAVGPLGPRLLVFPVELLGRQELLSHVVEWQAPAFDTLSQRAFLVQMMVAVLLLARRPSYRKALVMAVFLAAALLGSRNLTVASIALLPVLADSASGWGSWAAATRPRRGRATLLLALSCTILLVGARLDSPSLGLSAYPVDALAFLEEADVDTREHRLAAPEMVGNLLTFVYGPEGRRVFYDDRFDMFPDEVSEAQLALRRSDRTLFDELDRFDIELLVVPLVEPSALAITVSPQWRILYSDERWLVACERGSQLGGSVDRC